MNKKNNFLPVYIQLKKQLYGTYVKGAAPDSQLPTEHDLTKKHGVSKKTVRKALLELVNEGYIARISGKGTFVAGPKTKSDSVRTVAILATEITSGILIPLLKSIENKSHQNNVNLLLCNTDYNFQKQNEIVAMLLNRKTDGVFFLPLESNTEYEKNNYVVRKFLTAKIPIIQLDRCVDGMKTDYVTCDNYKGSYEMTEYLARMGHKKIGFIRLSDSPVVRDRIAGYKQALIDNKLHFNDKLISHGQELHDDANFINNYLKSAHVTAVFCINDLIAGHFIKLVKETGLKVPGDVSVVGFDNDAATDYIDPKLTTVEQPIIEMGNIGMELMLKRMNGFSYNDKPPEKIVLKTRLIIRDSVKKITRL
jgi:LacI family transcriptional regulator